ncbi:MAG: hypothetical protein WC798_00480 [Candidatus Paceibacterota bacterium]|jgi:hypothetical protein
MTRNTFSTSTFGFSVGSFVAGIMLGALLAGSYFLSGNFSLPVLPIDQRGADSPLSGTQDANLGTEKSGAVSVADQSSGSVVMVESITVPPPGVWVAVREVTGGKLGNVLGAARVDGPRSSVPVQLLRATEPGRSYAVELYRDDGNGTFDFAVNSVYVDFDTGASVVAYFKTTP